MKPRSLRCAVQSARRFSASLPILALLGAGIASIPPAAHAQSVYRDPNGAFTVQVPQGWGTQPQDNNQGVSVVNEQYQASVTVGVMRGSDSSAPSPQKELDSVEGQLGQSCKVNRRGATKVAGLSGVFFFASCMDNGKEEVMKFAAASAPGVMVVLNTAVPRSTLSAAQSTINTIEQSIALTGGSQAGGAGGSGNARQMAALRKACDTGALPADECAQKMAALNGQSGNRAPAQPYTVTQSDAAQRGTISSNDPNFNPNNPPAQAPAPPSSGAYRDSQGRYSLTVPAGWSATPENDGSGTLQLKNGSAWATVALMTGAGDSASRPQDIAHAILKQMAPQYRDAKVLNEGDFQPNGHPAHGANATGINSKGVRVSVIVVSIQASGLNFLSVISSAPNEQAKAINAQIMDMVQSIRFGGE